MTGTTGLTAADVLALTGEHNDGFGGVGLIILLFIFLIALFGGGFGGLGNRGAAPAIEGDLQRGFDYTTIVGKLDGISNGICDSTFALNNNIMNGTYQTQLGLANVTSQMQNCCCETNRNIDAVRYENAKNTCDIVNAIRTDGEATRSLITQNTIQQLRDELDQARSALSNSAQSRYILGELGSYYTNPPCYQRYTGGCGNTLY